jgi:hypothetical protein
MRTDDISFELYHVIYEIKHNPDNLCELSKKPFNQAKVKKFATDIEPGISDEDIKFLVDMLLYGTGKAEDLCDAYLCLINRCKCDRPDKVRGGRFPRPVWRL